VSFREFKVIWCRCIHIFEPVLRNAWLQLGRKREFDTHEVLAAAGTIRDFFPFKHGLVGGHCIGVDPC
jgi:UDP-N-acetyl-D-mannosaminuronate dehydrogenase